jgi:hypothetical protein
MAIEAGHKAMIGYWLSQDAGGRGVVTRSVQALARIAFDDLGLVRSSFAAARITSKAPVSSGALVSSLRAPSGWETSTATTFLILTTTRSS